jgi:pilus assembly protein CpaC
MGRMIFRAVLSVFLLFLFPVLPALGAEQALGLGEQFTLSVEPGTRFSVGNPEVIQVKSTQISGGKSILIVKGKSQGYSDLILIEGQGARRNLGFRVVSKRQAAMVHDGAGLFSGASGLRMQAVGGSGWIAQGDGVRLEDWNLMQTMVSSEKGRLQTRARLHPLERLKAEAGIRRLFAEAHLGHLSVLGAGSTVVLIGDASDAQEKELAETLARQVLADVRSQIRVPFERGGRLRFRAKILEVLRSGAQNLGLEWSQGVPSAIQISKNFSKLNLGLEAALQIMEKRGDAKLLSQPELLLNEKGVAELHVGGEIPIQLQSKFYANVEWKPYGLSLKLELPGVSRDLARARITVEISTLDPSNGVGGIPAIRMSRMDTQVDMGIGKAVLLSGLMENRESRNLSLVPGLGDIPVLGELFRSRDFQENRSELVILIEADA